MSATEPSGISVANSSVPLDAAKVIEWLFAATVLFLSTGAVFQLLARAGGQDVSVVGSSNPETTLIVASSGIAAVLLIRNWRDLLAVIRSAPSLWVLALMAAASSAWSSDPGRSMRSAVSLTAVMLFAVYLALRFDAAEQSRLVAFVMVVALAASVLTVVLDPALGIEPGIHQGEWRGIFVTKNAFGRVGAVAFMTFLILGTYRPRLRYLAWVAALGAIALVWLSHSRTSFFAAVGSVGWLAAQPILRRRQLSRTSIAVVLSTAATIACAIIWFRRDTLFVRSGDEETLTGRTVLWAVVTAKILLHPFLGYGYTAFWSGSRAHFVDVWRVVGWRPPHAHNGFLDVALDLGAVGLALLLSAIISCWYRSLRLARTSGNRHSQSWTSSVVLFTIITNLTESTLLRSNFFWILFTAAAINASRAEMAER